VDVRVISATNRSLPDLVGRGQFREDLMYRIMVVHLEVPPLRERREDIRQLVEYIIANGGTSLAVSEAALQALEGYRWPGNVRELQNVIEQLVWLHSGDTVGVNDLPPGLVNSKHGVLTPARERRKRVADHLYDALVSRSCSFWEHVYPLFINRDLTRADLIALVRQGLAASSGNYRALLQLFGMAPADYKRFLNLLSTHGCTVDFREFRTGTASAGSMIEPAFKFPMAKANLTVGDRARSGGYSA
jgi:DNA-binding NtrC family response regulator